jgi:type II secretory pathway pseudopilin PulG
MALRKKPDRPRRSRLNSDKVPLTYYRGKTGNTNSSPFQKRSPKTNKLKKNAVITLDVIIVVLLIVGLLYSLMLQPTPRIIASSRAYHDSKVYEAVAAAKLKSLQNRTKFTLDEKKLSDDLQAKFPEIADVNIELPILSPKPNIRLSISEPAFILSSQGQNFVVDRQGRAVAKQDSLPRITGLPLVIDQSGFSAASGKQIISAQGSNFINALISQCHLSNVPIQSLTLPSQAQELDLRTKDKPYFVKFFLGGDPASQIGQFIAARHQFAAGGDQPSQYLDVRVAGKIYYK